MQRLCPSWPAHSSRDGFHGLDVPGQSEGRHTVTEQGTQAAHHSTSLAPLH